VRQRILAGMEWCRVKVDPERNEANAELISAGDSACAVLVVAVDEESLIARRTVECLKEHQ
jgi:acetate kinase